MFDNDCCDNEGWTESKSKNRKHRSSCKMTSRSRSTSLALTTPSETVVKKKISKIGNISIWMTYVIDDDIEYLINENLKSINKKACSDILNLWDCLYHLLKSYVDISEEYKSSNQLKTSIYTSRLLKINSKNQDHDAINIICKKYKIKITFTSIDKTLTEVIYGVDFTPTIHILHIGLNWFLPLEPSDDSKEYKLSQEDKKIIENSIRPEKNVDCNLRSSLENKRLNQIRKILKGFERTQSFESINKLQNKLEYDIYTPEELHEMEDLILCKLKITGAHSGIAIPIHKSVNMKFEEIKLLNRRNCGYNAFDGDIVHVKINDSTVPTGKVMGVSESDHKPIYSVYLCKVSQDQGSLMCPLDNTFPKIHVDNQPGRRKHEIDNQTKNISYLKDEQKSVVERERESAKYADNLYYTLFDVNVSGNRPTFTPQSVLKFDTYTCDYYFVVCYERWDPQYMYPFGKIVGIFYSQDTLKNNFDLISSICNLESVNLTTQYEKEVVDILEQVNMLNESENYIPSDAVVFSIDCKNTKDIDDAISYHKEGMDTIIGIHISDVTKFVTSTHEIYNQAQSRFCTTYFSKFNEKPIHLIDERLSTNALSLIPNVPRAVVSVFFRFVNNLENIKISEIIFKEGVIVSKHKLTYEDASICLKQSEGPKNFEENLLEALRKSYEISKKLKKSRLPLSYFVRSANEFVREFYIENGFEAEILVEEFMLLANEHVARKIYEKYPDSTLLRIQNPVRNYEDWQKNLFQSTNMEFIGELNSFCNLLNIKYTGLPNKKGLLVSRKFFDRFNSLVKRDPENARNLLSYDKYYNDFVMHIIDWYKINYPARYECSIKDCVNNKHFSLNKNLYTHFTSPIRRFSDIVVHLLLKSVINNYEITDKLNIDHICNIANHKLRANDKFDEICTSYAIFEEHKTFCFILDCVCSEINSDEILVIHHLLQKTLSSKTIKFANLALDDLQLSDLIDGRINNCTLKWRRIIFSCPPRIINDNVSKSTFVIDKDLYNAYLSQNSCKLFGTIRRSCTTGKPLKKNLNDLVKQFKISTYETVVSSDSFSFFNPIIDIHLQVFLKSTIRMQFCKYKVHGLPKISPELYIVAPTFQICLIHHVDPVRFFVPGGKLKLKFNDIQTKFNSIDEYKEYFEPLIHAESLQETLSENVSFSLLYVKIKWILKVYSQTKTRYGVIILPDEFCQNNNIAFSNEKHDIINRYEYLIDEEILPFGSDLLCLRFKSDTWNNYWIGHGEVVHVSKFQPEQIIYKIIIFLLTHSDFDAFTKIQEENTYSVDVYRKSIVTRRQQVVMNSLDCYTLVKDIIMGIHLTPHTDYCDILETETMFLFNENQKKALIRALKHKFSLIWGPPGTGKTFIGCSLSYEYFKRNLSDEGVILFCGPSNDCVDLVALYLKEKFKDKCPKLLRIYGEQQELADFPIPGYFVKNKLPLSNEMKSLSLHFLIRKEENFADLLKGYDEKFRDILKSKQCNSNENIHDLIIKYKKLLKEAKSNYVSKAKCDIVLCTISVTAKHIIKNLNITQIIIDEAGMCKEPETLIPIFNVKDKIKNIVLIGDHKQLRPVIRSHLAKSRGLQISLFERYQHFPNRVVTMLDYQYRMHPSICEFPSREFYASKLKTQTSNLWSGLTADDMKVNLDYYNNEWNGLDCNLPKIEYEKLLKKSNYQVIENEKWPRRGNMRYICFDRVFSFYPERTIFIDVIGTEIIQSITTSLGNEKSRSNQTEVDVCGYIYKKLIENGAPSNSITMLTQYKLQQNLLKMECQKILRSKKINFDPIVKTVIRSQGSENDYIIFSTVRSLKNKSDINSHPTQGWEKEYLGFITDPNQINVALTRAKKGLIIIGNKQLLQVNHIWKNLIDDYNNRKCIIKDYLNFI